MANEMDKIREELRSLNIASSQIARDIGALPQTVSGFLRGRGLNYRRFEQVCIYLGYSKETAKEKFTAINNLSGQRIGSWLLLEKKSIDHKIAYLCRCECGTERVVPLTRLNSGCSKSCGCKRLERRTEGQEKGYELGKKVTNALHTAGLSAAYETKVANKNSRSGIRGVCPWGEKWRASITAAGEYYHLGIFDKLEDAIAARKEAEERLHKPLAEKTRKIKEQIKNPPS